MKQRFTKRTRLVSALLTLAMVFTFLPFSAFAAEEEIPIDATNFPDEAFRNYLLNENSYLTSIKIDKDSNGKLSEEERNAVDTIKVTDGYNGKKLTSLKGIEFFPNLRYLYCDENNLTSLNVSKNKKLEELYCDENNLNSLDVSQNTALLDLICSQNNLTSLDVGNNAALINLVCWKNQLTSLDVSNNPELKFLNCDQNQLTSLNVEKTSIYLSNPYSGFHAKNNTYPIAVGSDRTFDLSTLPGFDVTKADNWVGGSVNGNTLTVNKDATQVTYTYDCGKGCNTTFTLNVTGGTTIPPEAGKYQLTVTDGVATVNGKTGAVLNVKPGDTVTLTADTTKFPENEEFGWWEITPYGSVSNTLTGQYQRTATFTMPNENVSARAMSKSAGVSTGGDDGGGGGGAAILLVGGAAVAGLVGYGVYSYVSEQQLKALLPEGVAMPENRAQTALLLWNTAGRPEPAEAPAFKDVADPDTAKAAQWCVEHGLMDQKLGGRFAPDNSDPAYKTLNAYQQLVG